MHAHHVSPGGERDERHEREGNPERQHDLAQHERVGGVHAHCQDRERRQHRDRAAQLDGNAHVDKAGHHHLAGVRSDARGGRAGGKQRDGERQRGSAADELAQLCVRFGDAGDGGKAVGVEELRGHREHRHVQDAGEAQGDDHVEPLEAQHARPLVLVADGRAAVRERGMQIDHVRHHRGADDANGQIQRAGAAQARHEPAQRVVRGGADAQRLIQQAEEDQAQQRGDRKLKAAVAARLQLEDRKGDRTRH